METKDGRTNDVEPKNEKNNKQIGAVCDGEGMNTRHDEYLAKTVILLDRQI
jgi:hypothetical protein